MKALQKLEQKAIIALRNGRNKTVYTKPEIEKMVGACLDEVLGKKILEGVSILGVQRND